jgi:hypothetical protein
MSDVIQKVGDYKQRNGGKAEVRFLDGVAYGRDDLGSVTVWATTTGSVLLDTGRTTGVADIVGEWQDPPAPPEPGEGWRLLEEGELPQEGDECRSRTNTKDEWTPCLNWSRNAPQSSVCIYRRRIPKPFRISDHGPGVYETRDGREAKVDDRNNLAVHVWGGLLVCPPEGALRCTWTDAGRWSADITQTHRNDLVRYIGPLPVEEPWVPTCELRWDKCSHTMSGATIVSTGNYALNEVCRLEQRWTRGTEEEWRPVKVDGAD